MVTWHPQTRQDLLDIYFQLGLKNRSAAESFYDSIETKAELLPRYPRIGPRREIIGAAVRILIEPPYLILYETHPNTDEGAVDAVEIVRVVDGRRDLSQPF